MSGASDYLENRLLNHLLRAVVSTAPASVYISLHTSDPTDANLATEVAGNGYARVQLTVGFNAASAGQTANTGAISFPTPTGPGWGTVTHFGIYDASSSGNLLFSGAFASSRSIAAADTVRFAAGDLVISCD
jgi:hypothetical protein